MENKDAKETQNMVQPVASLVEMACASLLNSPRSMTSMTQTIMIKAVQIINLNEGAR